MGQKVPHDDNDLGRTIFAGIGLLVAAIVAICAMGLPMFLNQGCQP